MRDLWIIMFRSQNLNVEHGSLDYISEVFFQPYISHLYVEVFSSLSNFIIKRFPVVFHLMSQVFRRRYHYVLQIKK